MSEIVLKRALEILRMDYSCGEADNFSIITINQTSTCNNFHAIIRFWFEEDYLNKIEIEEDCYLKEYFHKFLIKHVIANTKYQIELVTENKFKYTKFDSIKKANKFANEIIDHIQSIIISFMTFMEILKKTYETYSQNSLKWVIENMPEKQTCLAACWNIPKNSSFIVINEQEFRSRTMITDFREFTPFTIVITTLNTREINIKVLFPSLINESYKMIEMIKPIGKDFKELLIEISEKVLNGTDSINGSQVDSFLLRGSLSIDPEFPTSNQAIRSIENPQTGKYRKMDISITRS